MATTSPTPQPSRRKALNKDQLNVLYTLYKFRFGTTDLLKTTQSKNISRKYMNTRLRILCEQEYIGREYDSSYRLQAKFAQYYLLPKGIEVLKQHPEHFNKHVLRNVKKDVEASDRFIRHSINIFAIYARLKEIYGGASDNSFHFYTRSYMVGDQAEGFPKPLPDAFASFKTLGSQKISHFIIECFDDTMPQSVMRKRIEQLVDHADNDEWILTKTYPAILLVCETVRLQKAAHRWAATGTEQGWSNDLIIEVKTIESLSGLE
jgi:DNA-binding HxlR family transcriptional regulator